ncbi:zinc-binding alcohol dehydrogenase family protein [Salicibibacter halophilus]|uniref:Zinc-binding alcohol dehydrogenase family protein n=1 Tax=Salicibibacter halophilus TaxID=2502791 RepID=A0A514LJR6_9BACI|nr:zinc-binding alcohol dehydrogenase family protein [Salicibibacter halophilus]QDI92104.1 zinc-binding alcohol dehydrogenase family protein [Salicibibacter halophilus]
MQAIQVFEPGSLDIVKKRKPEIERSDDVLVNIKAVGICGSDMHIYHGSNPFTVYPRVIGHEVSGEIESVGSGVSTFKPGDRVSLEPISYCGSCYACRQGRPNVCVNLEVFGVHQDGGMREFMVAPEDKWHKVSSHVSFEAAALAEPMTIGAQATMRGNVQKGDTVLIMGAGPTGLSCLLMAKEHGATTFISDFNQERLDYAKSIGADYLLNPREEDLEKVVADKTDQELANVVIDAVGTAETFEQAVTLASIAGNIVTLGFNEQPSSIPSFLLTKKELTITGSRLQTNQFKAVIQQMNSGDINPEAMISHTFPFHEVKDAFELLENPNKEARKIVLTF